MEELWSLGVSKQDGYQTLSIHQAATGIEIVFHRGKCFAGFQAQYQVVRSTMGKRRRDAEVKIIMRVAEQAEDGGHKLRRRKRAARGRRLQRNSNDRSVSAALDRDVRVVECQGEYALAMHESESRAKRNGCMTTEWHFGFWREIAYSPACACRNSESRLRESNIRCDSLRLLVGGELIANQDACGIASGIPIRERSNS